MDTASQLGGQMADFLLRIPRPLHSTRCFSGGPGPHVLCDRRRYGVWDNAIRRWIRPYEHEMTLNQRVAKILETTSVSGRARPAATS